MRNTKQQHKGFTQHHFPFVHAMTRRMNVSYGTNKKNGAGFTLVEILVVVAVIGMLASIIWVALGGTTDKARIAKGESFDAQLYHVLGESLRGMWTFDEGIQGSALDTSGYGNNGTVNGATLAPDRNGQDDKAYSFDGNDYINYGDILDSTFTGASKDFTVTAWFKTSATTGDWTSWLFQYASPWSAQFAIGMIVSPGSGIGRFTLDHNNNVGLCSTATTYNNGVWHHLVVTRNDSANQVKWYFDGVNTDTCGDVTIGNASNFYIGAQVTSPANRYWVGGIDDVRVYGQTLTAGKIQQMYAEGMPKHQVVLRTQEFAE